MIQGGYVIQVGYAVLRQLLLLLLLSLSLLLHDIYFSNLFGITQLIASNI